MRGARPLTAYHSTRPKQRSSRDTRRRRDRPLNAGPGRPHTRCSVPMPASAAHAKPASLSGDVAASAVRYAVARKWQARVACAQHATAA